MYNYNNLKYVSGNNIVKLLKFIYGIYKPKQLATRLKLAQQYKAAINYKGEKDLHLTNPKELLKHKDDSQLEVYLHLLSLRNMAEVAITGENSIPTYIAEQFYELDQLKYNKLLTFKQNNIYFK